MHKTKFLLPLIFNFVLSVAVNAQIPPDTNLFQWKFANNFLATELPSCDTLSILVSPVNATNITHGIPPFYMIAWEIDGTPSTTLLGLNESSLSWTVNHPVGTLLMLNVVDSQGNGGGIPPQLYTVVDGQTTECIISGNSTDFTVSANISDTVNTCQPWGLRIQGGVPPYNVSFAQVNSPVVTNVTIPDGLNGYTYINRGTPGYLLLAAVSDVTGRWAFGTPTVNPTGSEDISCIGLNSEPGNSTLLDEAQAAALDAIAAAKRKKTATLAGVLTPLLLLLFGGLAFWSYRYYKRQENIRKELTPEPLAFTEPKFIEEASLDAGASVGAESNMLSNSDFTSTRSASPSLNPFMTEAERAASRDGSSSQSAVSVSRPNSGSSTGDRQGFASFPTTSVRLLPSKKAIEAGFVMNDSGHGSSLANTVPLEPPRNQFASVQRSQSAQAIGTTPSSSRIPTRSATFSALIRPSSGGESEYVIQHKDGGRFRELPPPYAERRSRAVPDVPQSP